MQVKKVKSREFKSSKSISSKSSQASSSQASWSQASQAKTVLVKQVKPSKSSQQSSSQASEVMLDRDTAPRKCPSPSLSVKKINQNIQTARILTQQRPLPSKPIEWTFAQASHEYTAGMESVPTDTIHPHETSDLTTTVSVYIYISIW